MTLRNYGKRFDKKGDVGMKTIKSFEGKLDIYDKAYIHALKDVLVLIDEIANKNLDPLFINKEELKARIKE